MSNDNSNALWEPVAQGLQWLGEKTVELASKGAQAAIAGVGALLAAIPGMGSVGEAMGAAAAKGAEAPERSSSAPVVAASTPQKAQAPEVEAPSQPKVITLPAAAYAAVQAIKENPVSMEVASLDEGQALGGLARANTPSMGVQLGGGMGRA